MKFDEMFDDLPQGFQGDKRKKVGGYVLGKILGEGSFAKVRLGVHLLTKQRVAVKVISKRLAQKREYVRKNMRREAALLQRLRHPNIVQLYEVLETENSFYIVMELADGGDLIRYLNQKKRVSEPEARRYLRQIASAVEHLHRAGVIHRDLKVENLLLDKDMNIKIIDFGLSNFWDGETLLTTQCGSPAYAAPEVFSHRCYGPLVDVWSIGVNLYAMLTGRLPFMVNSPTNLVKLHALMLKGCRIPSVLSAECQDLLYRLLHPAVTKRITMAEIFSHPWINEGYVPLTPFKLKARLDPSDVNSQMINYVARFLNMGESEACESVTLLRPCAATAAYMLLCTRLGSGQGLPNISTNNDIGDTMANGRAIVKHVESCSLGRIYGSCDDILQKLPTEESSSRTPRDNPDHSAQAQVFPKLEGPVSGLLEARRQKQAVVIPNGGSWDRDENSIEESEVLPDAPQSRPEREDRELGFSEGQSHSKEPTSLSVQPRQGILKSQKSDDAKSASKTRERDTSPRSSGFNQQDAKVVRFAVSGGSQGNADYDTLTPSDIRALSDRFILNRIYHDRMAGPAAPKALEWRKQANMEAAATEVERARAQQMMRRGISGAVVSPPAPPNSALLRQKGRRPLGSLENQLEPRNVGHISDKFSSPPVGVQPDPSHRRIFQLTVGSLANDAHIYDSYKFKVRTREGERKAVWDFKALHAPVQKPSFPPLASRSRTLTDMGVRKFGAQGPSAGDRPTSTKEVETDREAFLQLNEGLLSILIPKVGGNKGQVSTPAVRTEV